MTKPENPSSSEIQFAPKKVTQTHYHSFHLFSIQQSILPAGAGWIPSVDLYETAEELVLEVSLGGIPPEQVQVTFEGGSMHIIGQREKTGAPGVRCYHVMEIERGSFGRTIDLPVAVDGRTAQAEYHDGFLVLRVKKKETGQIHGCFSADSMEGLE